MSIKVFPANVALAAVQANPDAVLKIERKKDDKLYRGTRFLNAFWNIGADVKKDGWFSLTDVVLPTGIADPNNAGDKRNEYDGTRLQLQTTVSNSGDFGQFLLALNPEWKKAIDELISNNLINATGKKVHDLLRLNLSESNEKAPGAPIDDPIIQFKIDFDAFPQRYKHKFLVGQPRTQFFDYRTAYVDGNGITQYKPAMVIDPVTEQEVPVNEANLHLFITPGSILRYGRVMMGSVAISQYWISLPMTINRAVIEPGEESGFSDEKPVNMSSAVREHLLPAISAAPKETKDSKKEEASEAKNDDKKDIKPESANDNIAAELDDISDVLASI